MNDREFVAAESSHGVSVPDDGFQSLRHRLQQRVPDGVAQRIVDGLEPIEIEAVQSQRVAALDVCDTEPDTLVKESAIGKACQSVVVCQAPYGS